MSPNPKAVDTGGAAFPKPDQGARGSSSFEEGQSGMSLRDWHMGQALSNPELCSGRANDYDLSAWFGKDASGLTAFQIAAKQAALHADALIAERNRGEKGEER